MRVKSLVDLGYLKFIGKNPGLDFDIHQKSTWELLKNNIALVNAILKPAVREALSNENFFQHVRNTKCTQLKRQTLVRKRSANYIPNKSILNLF